MADLDSTSALYAARPSVQMDGSEHAALTDGLEALLVEETPEGLYRCEATFGNWGPKNGSVTYLYLDRDALDFGKSISIVAGDGDAAGVIFAGHITGIEAEYPQTHPPAVTVLAEDRLQDLRMVRRTRTFEQMSDRDVFDQVASAHGLQRTLDVDGPTHDVLAQVNQSDLAFLRERARAVDAELWLEGDALHVVAAARLNRGQVTLAYGSGLFEFSALADVARQRTRMTVSGWDVDAKQGIASQAGPAALQSELGGLVSGASVLSQAFGERAEQLAHLAPVTQDEARALAEAQFRMIGRRFVTGRGVAEGDSRIRVGARVTLERLGGLFDGEYTVSGARHTFDGQHGYRTRFVVERAGLGTPP